MAPSSLVIPNREMFKLDEDSSKRLLGYGRPRKPLRFRPQDLPARKRLEPKVICLFGRRGQGKTLFATAAGSMMQDRYTYHGNKMKVASNYWVDFVDYQDPELVQWVLSFPPEARDMVLLLDEIGTIVPNRQSITHRNTLFAAFLTQIRKRHMECIFTTQFPQTLDYQVIIQVDLFVECEKFFDGRAVKHFIHDYWGQETGLMFKKPWPPPRYYMGMPFYDWTWKWFNLDKVWGHYDTDQVIAPMWLNKERRRTLAIEEWQGKDSRSLWNPQEPQPEVIAPQPTLATPEEPTDFTVYLETHFGTSGFGIRGLMDKAKEYEVAKTPKEFSLWLLKHGWTVEGKGSAIYAHMRPGGPYLDGKP